MLAQTRVPSYSAEDRSIHPKLHSSGPVCFGVPLMAFLKQHLLLNVLILGLFAQAVMMPVGNTLMMQIQLGVQVQFLYFYTQSDSESDTSCFSFDEVSKLE